MAGGDRARLPSGGPVFRRPGPESDTTPAPSWECQAVGNPNGPVEMEQGLGRPPGIAQPGADGAPRAPLVPRAPRRRSDPEALRTRSSEAAASSAGDSARRPGRPSRSTAAASVRRSSAAFTVSPADREIVRQICVEDLAMERVLRSGDPLLDHGSRLFDAGQRDRAVWHDAATVRTGQARPRWHAPGNPGPARARFAQVSGPPQSRRERALSKRLPGGFVPARGGRRSRGGISGGAAATSATQRKKGPSRRRPRGHTPREGRGETARM